MSGYEFGDPRLPDRFWSRVSVAPNGCWLWTGCVNHNGYGKTTLGGRHLRSHRAAYQTLVAAIPDGLYMDHLCRTPACVNPAHLEPVTPRENVVRGESPTAKRSRQTHCKRGHALEGANLFFGKGGKERQCKECHRVRGAANRKLSKERKQPIATHGDDQ